jgi:hypothetical protein
MLLYDWEGAALDEETRERRWLQGQFTVEDLGGALNTAFKLAQRAAVNEGCDPDSIEEVIISPTDCDHAEFEVDMDDSAKCLMCGKCFKGLPD